MNINMIIHTNMYDDFKCKCGNTTYLDGFETCNNQGQIVEPDTSWEGHYKCMTCNQIYIEKEVE
jgi:hypothetical protein